ncbi:MFS transporter (plasmid) [Legionella sp. D16C41]|uniref:MFS transporter n=1 Tax=Legionella sp. D16C41 TaxID=3402688 RepID=UPI003AF61604
MVVFFNFTGSLSNDIYLPGLITIAKSFYTSEFMSQLTVSMWFLGAALPQPYFGILANRYGPRKLMIGGSILFILATAGCGLAWNIYSLLTFRFGQGAAVASAAIASLAIVQDPNYSSLARLRFITWIYISDALTPLLGPLVGSFLISEWGWRSSFALLLILGIICASGLYYFLPRNKDGYTKTTWKSFYQPSFGHPYLWKLIILFISFYGSVVAYITTAPFIIMGQLKIPIKYFGITQIFPFLFFVAGGLTLSLLMTPQRQKKFSHLGVVIMFISVLIFLAMNIFTQYFTLSYFLLAISTYLYGFSLTSNILAASILSINLNKAMIAAIFGVSLPLIAVLSSLLTATFYNNNLWGFSTIFIAFFFIALILYIYILKSKPTFLIPNNDPH